MLLILCMGSTVDVSAATYGKKESGGTYKIYKNTTRSGRTHHIYLNTNQRDKFYKKKTLTPIVKHVKGHGADTLVFSTTQSLTTTKTTSWDTNASISNSIGMDLEIFQDTVSLSVSNRTGGSTATGRTFSKASGVNKTIKDTAKTGYYTRVPGYTYSAMEDIIVKNSNGSLNTIYYRMPYGDPIIYTIYSSNNKNWSVY